MPANLNWLDVGVILVLAVFALEGVLKGLIQSVFNMLGIFIAIYAGKVAAPIVAAYISDHTGIDEYIKNNLADKAGTLDTAASIFQMGEKGGLEATDILTSILLIVICFFIIFLAVRMVLYIIAGALDMVAKLPVLKQFNKLGGLVFGLLKGAVILYIVFALLTPVLPLLMPDNPLVEAVEQSVFAGNFYRYNIVIPYILGGL